MPGRIHGWFTISWRPGAQRSGTGRCPARPRPPRPCAASPRGPMSQRKVALQRAHSGQEQPPHRTHSCACGKCNLKPECTRADRCSMTRPADMATRRWVDDHLATARAKRALRTRSCWVETVFADLKCNHTLARARFRGKAFEVQALLAAAAHNIEQLAKSTRPRARAQRLPALALVPLDSPGWMAATGVWQQPQRRSRVKTTPSLTPSVRLLVGGSPGNPHGTWVRRAPQPILQPRRPIHAGCSPLADGL